MIAELAAAGLTAYSALSAKKGQDAANARTFEFNSDEARKQREWEQMMFQNRYQFTRKDLEAAGYNPLMALGLNPGVPSGASAHSEAKSSTSEAAHIVSSGAKNAMDTSVAKAMIGKVEADSASAQALARIHQQEADIATSSWGKKAAAFHYFMQKTGIGKFAAGAASAYGASKVFKAVGKMAVRRGSGFRMLPVANPYDFEGASA